MAPWSTAWQAPFINLSSFHLLVKPPGYWCHFLIVRLPNWVYELVLSLNILVCHYLRLIEEIKRQNHLEGIRYVLIWCFCKLVDALVYLRDHIIIRRWRHQVHYSQLLLQVPRITSSFPAVIIALDFYFSSRDEWERI